MAKPTTFISERRDPEENVQAKLNSVPVQHAAALLDAYQTMQAFHDAGVFDILRGLTGAQKQIIGQLAAAANAPEMIRGLRNLLILIKLLGNIDPVRLQTIVTGISEATQRSDSTTNNPPGTLSLLNRTRSTETRRALGLAVEVLESVGREMRSEK